MFTVGSKVIHPLHGLGTVEKIEEKTILGQLSKFACISFQNDRLKIMVNLEQRNSMIRPLVEASEIDQVMDHLRNCEGNLPTKSSERYNINLKKIKSCDIYQLAEVVRDLTGLSRQKKLSPKEQQMLKQSRKMLSVEFSYVTSRDEEEMEALVDATCRNEETEVLIATA
jgi:CarD family transcriptional regulator